MSHLGSHLKWLSDKRLARTRPAEFRARISTGAATRQGTFARTSDYRTPSKLIRQMSRSIQGPLASEYPLYGASTDLAQSAERRPPYWIREGVRTNQPQQHHFLSGGLPAEYARSPAERPEYKVSQK